MRGNDIESSIAASLVALATQLVIIIGMTEELNNHKGQ
jgi:hypothetical protein